MHDLLRKNKFKLNHISKDFIQTSNVNSALTPLIPGCVTQIWASNIMET